MLVRSIVGAGIGVSIGMSILLLGACENDGSSSGAGSPDLTVDQPDLIDQVKGDIFKVSISVKDIPATVAYNLEQTPAGYVEYRWVVTFDMDNDGVIDAGDIMFELAKRNEKSNLQQSGSVADFSAYMRILTDSGAGSSHQGMELDTEISANTISFLVDLNAHPQFAEMHSDTMVYFETSIFDSLNGQFVHDYYPAANTLVNVPQDKSFTDAEGDAAFDIIDMLSMHFEIIPAPNPLDGL